MSTPQQDPPETSVFKLELDRDELSKQCRYAAFRFKMWTEGRGSYAQIDQDFADGKLDAEWKEHCKAGRK